MATDLDELFLEGEGAPRPRALLVWSLTITGTLLALLGVVCTAAPGGLLVLLGWMVVEKEMDRVDSGYLAADTRPAVARMRAGSLVALAVVIATFLVQGVLLFRGVYNAWWGPPARAFAEWFWAL